MPEEPYTLRILRLDLGSGVVTDELIDLETAAPWVGCIGLAMRCLRHELVLRGLL